MLTMASALELSSTDYSVNLFNGNSGNAGAVGDLFIQSGTGQGTPANLSQTEHNMQVGIYYMVQTVVTTTTTTTTTTTLFDFDISDHGIEWIRIKW